MTDQPPRCHFTLHHRGNAIGVQLAARFDVMSNNNTLWVCDTTTQSGWQFQLPDTLAGEFRWVIPESLIPSGHYQAWLTGDTLGTCAASPVNPRDQSGLFIKRPRKVDEQMRQLFNGTTNDN